MFLPGLATRNLQRPIKGMACLLSSPTYCYVVARLLAPALRAWQSVCLQLFFGLADDIETARYADEVFFADRTFCNLDRLCNG